MTMSDTLYPKHQDKRTIERHLRSGAVDEKVWEKHLKSLADVAEKAAPVEAVLAPTDDEDEDEDEDDEG
jgi:hypothetical protein